MKRAYSLGLLMLLAAALFILPACDSGGGGGGSTRTLVGSWVVVSSSIGPSVVGDNVVFRADGTGTWNADPITYTYVGNTLVVTGMGSIHFVLDWLSDNKIQLTMLVGGNWFNLVRI